METPTNSSRTIQSVETTFTLLDEIRRRNGAGVTELADVLDLSKSAVHHHVATLEKENFLTKIDGKYRIGLRFLTFGSHSRKKEEIFENGKNDADTLARKTGETVRLIVENSGYGLTLYQSTGQKVENPRTHLGMVEHLHSTAAGKAFLAALPQEEVETIIEEWGLKQFTENTITEREELQRELKQIREHGFAFDDREQFDEIRCVATTITADSGDLLGAISIAAPIDRMDDHRFRYELPRLLQNVVEMIERVDEYRFRHELPCISRTLPK
ncbi:IclR family transcriptional regulator [Halocatena marina]|uniref:IclR family transcriptional regulator n=1 Tax=Halocatena marina TaxID=2934937 RepID=A0ABD5YPP1_9EURY|nr:IclR family transcriptional regulator [Halocatena marina]